MLFIVAMLSALISVCFMDSFILSNYLKSFYFYCKLTIFVGMSTPSFSAVGFDESAKGIFLVTFDFAANYFYFSTSRPFILPFSAVRWASETAFWILRYVEKPGLMGVFFGMISVFLICGSLPTNFLAFFTDSSLFYIY